MEDLQRTATKGISDTFGTTESDSLKILIATLIVLLPTLLFMIFTCVCRRRGRFDRFALLGLGNAGKTRMLCELIKNGRSVETYTSMKENVWQGPLDIAGGGRASICIVDVPGSEKIRRQVLDQHKSLLIGLIFVIDSSTFSKEAKDVAEYVYDVLVDPSLSRKDLRVLIACNKQDLPIVKSAEVIRAQLEKEFALLTRTREAALESTEGEGVKGTLPVDKSGAFSFAKVKQRVEFCECAAGGKGEGLGAVGNWLSR